MTRIFKVTDELYFSGEINKSDIKLLIELGIQTILNLMLELTYETESLVKLIHIPIRDGERIPSSKLTEIYTTIDQFKKDGMLIHCAVGVSRSAGIIIGQLMRENPKWNWSDAESYLRKIRWVIPDLNIRDSILEFISR